MQFSPISKYLHSFSNCFLSFPITKSPSELQIPSSNPSESNKVKISLRKIAIVLSPTLSKISLTQSSPIKKPSQSSEDPKSFSKSSPIPCSKSKISKNSWGKNKAYLPIWPPWGTLQDFVPNLMKSISSSFWRCTLGKWMRRRMRRMFTQWHSTLWRVSTESSLNLNKKIS